MKLNGVENIIFDQSQNIVDRGINQDCDPRNIRRQLPNPNLLAAQVQETLRSGIEVESESIRAACDRGGCFSLVFDAANFYVHTIWGISEETLHLQRVTFHGEIFCC